MIPLMVGVSAFVLAGGQSSRMGSDKAFLKLAGSTLIERMVLLVRAIAPKVCIVGSAEKFRAHGEVIEDQFPGCGPLAGIHAALQASSTDLSLIVAVDMPFVVAEFLEFLIEQASTTDVLATVPRAEGHWQPLCAVYRREFAAVAEESLREGKYKIDPLFRRVKVLSIEESDLRERGFSSEMFRNLNTPEDWSAASVSTREQQPHAR